MSHTTEVFAADTSMFFHANEDTARRASDSNHIAVGGLILDAMQNSSGISYAKLPIPNDVMRAKAEFSEYMMDGEAPLGYTFKKRTHAGLLLRREMKHFKDVITEQQRLLEAVTGRAALFGSITYNHQTPGAIGDEHQDGLLSIVYGSGDVSIHHSSKNNPNIAAHNAQITESSIAVVNGIFPRFLGGEARIAPKHRFDNPSSEASRDSIVFSFYLAPFTALNRSKR
jgi:hypothetical protein